MRRKNQTACNTGLLLILIGIGMILFDIFWIKTQKTIWISIGCSLLASGIVTLVQTLLFDETKVDYAEEWGLTKIYKARSEKSEDSDPKLEKNVKRLDVVAFGLKSFREGHTKRVEKMLKRGGNIRILTMNPDENNYFLKQREKEENELQGQIRNSINELIKWADRLNARGYKGKIYIKGYKCMTLDFYWRIDDEVYIGPYWYGIGSQQTITYRFEKGKRGFELYANYFDDLWENTDNTCWLTKERSSENEQ